jgi:hypothetical protein
LLGNGDFVEEPIGASGIGHVFDAIGESHAVDEAVAIPMLAAGELPQIGFGECLRVRHGIPPC